MKHIFLKLGVIQSEDSYLRLEKWRHDAVNPSFPLLLFSAIINLISRLTIAFRCAVDRFNVAGQTVKLSHLGLATMTVIINGDKYACESCVRGHRVSKCQHVSECHLLLQPTTVVQHSC